MHMHVMTALVMTAMVCLRIGMTTAVVENQPHMPAGISDLLAAMPTMLSPLDQRGKKNAVRTGNAITISGSNIVFARSDKSTLVETIESMIRNSEPGAVGDAQLKTSILTVLEADGSDQETKVAQQIQETLECRAHKEKLRKCVETLVDVAVPADRNNKEVIETKDAATEVEGAGAHDEDE